MTALEFQTAIERLGYTQQELAEALGCTTRTIRRKIAGKSPISKLEAKHILELANAA